MHAVFGYIGLLALAFSAPALFGAAAPVAIVESSTGIRVVLDSQGHYVISTSLASWKFAGDLGPPA